MLSYNRIKHIETFTSNLYEKIINNKSSDLTCVKYMVV